MKKINLFPAVFFYLFMVTFFILRVHYQNDKAPWVIYLIIILSGFPFAWMYQKMFMSKLEQIQDDLLEEEPELGQPILERACMNHFRGMIADGGVGYILQDQLVFIPHKMNLNKKQLDIQFSDIKHISGYKVLGIFDTGLKMEMKSGKIEKFVIDKTNSFYEMLINRS